MMRLVHCFLIALLGVTAPAASALGEPPKKAYDRGYRSHMQGRYEQAVKQYSKAIERKPDYVLAYQMRAAAWHSLKNLDQAAQDYSKVIRLGENYFRAVGHFNRGLVYYDGGRYVDAIVDFTSAVSLDRKMGMAYLLRGIAKSRIGDRNGQVNDFVLASRYGDFQVREMLERYAPHLLKK